MDIELRDKYIEEVGKTNKKLQKEGVYYTHQYVSWLESLVKKSYDIHHVSMNCRSCKYLLDNGDTEHRHRKYTCLSDGNNILSPNDYGCIAFEKHQK